MRTFLQIAIPLWAMGMLALGYFVMSSIRIQYRNWEEAGAFKYEHAQSNQTDLI